MIKVESEGSKWEILRSARKLRSSNEFRNVYVNKDLIKEDREKEKKLRYELKERRDKENGVFVIKGGKVVEVKDGLNRRKAYAREGGDTQKYSKRIFTF